MDHAICWEKKDLLVVGFSFRKKEEGGGGVRSIGKVGTTYAVRVLCKLGWCKSRLVETLFLEEEKSELVIDACC